MREDLCERTERKRVQEFMRYKRKTKVKLQV